MSESYIALYRKYRPASFADLVGQEEIVSVLQGQLNKQSTGHAYLFFGTRGLGKTSVARIFAKELGCSSEDIYEIDGASNRKIEHIRELRESVYSLPFSSPFKVYIIDEVHMLTKEAFNALLKTLEEPPKHVVFMLATTELHKVPDTIISRCQIFTFRQPEVQTLAKHAMYVAKQEGYELLQVSADLVALLAKGSFRDMLGVLEKAISVSKDGVIDPEEIALVLGAPSQQQVRNYVQALASKDPVAAYGVMDALTRGSVSMKLFGQMVLQMLRTILRARFDEIYFSDLKNELPAEDYTLVQTLRGGAGANLNAELLVRFMQVLLSADRSSIPAIPFEALVVMMSEG